MEILYYTAANYAEVTIYMKPEAEDSYAKKYKQTKAALTRYEKDISPSLPELEFPPSPYRILFEFGVSEPFVKWDEFYRPIYELVMSHYRIPFSDVKEGNIKKTLVNEGDEFIFVRFESTK